MRVRDYDYEYDEFDEEEELEDERKLELISEIRDHIIRGNIPLYKILEVCKTNAEDNYVFNWLERNEIKVSGIAGSLSGEFENYRYIPKMGQSYLPDVLEEAEQERLFNELDDLKKQGLNIKNSKKYLEIRNTLVEHNMRLAMWVARSKYLNNLDLDKDDIKQAAMESLIKIVEKFDVSYGTKFSTYAVKNIYFGARNEKRRDEKYKPNIDAEWKRLQRYAEELLRDENRLPTYEEIKEFLGTTDQHLKTTLRDYINYQHQESYEHLGEDDEDKIIQELLNDELVSEVDRKQIIDGVYVDESGLTEQIDERSVEDTAISTTLDPTIDSVLDTLTPRESEILKLRFGLESGKPMTLEQIRKNDKSLKFKSKPNRTKRIKKIKISW